MPVIAFDATPLTPYPGSFGGHAVRGIGRYIAAVLRSLSAEAAYWTEQNLLLVRTADVEVPWWHGDHLITRRARARPQDLGWFTSPLFDRLALGRRKLGGWTSSDPTSPLAPLGSGRSVVIAYDLIPLADPQAMAAMRAHRRLVYRLYLQRLKRADIVIAISNTVATDLTNRLGIQPERIRVVYPGLEMAPRRYAGPLDASPDLLFVGVPAAYKNPGAAVSALAELRRRGHDIRLRFVGTHFPAARRDLEGRAATAGVERHVEFLDQVPDALLGDLYASSVLLAPSTIEGLGLGPIEALLAGGRVVCGPAPVFRETVGDLAQFAGSADPLDPAAAPDLADAYERAIATGITEPQRAALAERFAPAACASAAIAAFERLRSSSAT